MASTQRYQPEAMLLGPISRTWLTTGNTDTVTDVNISSATAVVIIHNVKPVGFWQVVVTPTKYNSDGTLSAGSFTVTSSSVEQNTLTYLYKYL